MRGYRALRSLAAGVLALGGFAAAPAAHAFEAFDGRLQLHGFFESQLRLISADYNEQWDLTQWYQVLNLELELDIIQERYAGIDLLSAYVRVEGRFDCTYYRACGTVKGADAFGDRTRYLPQRLSNSSNTTSSGTIFISNDGLISPDRRPVPLSDVPGFSTLANTEGQVFVEPPASPGGAPTLRSGITPFDYVFQDFLDYRFTNINLRGGRNDGTNIRSMAPWLPEHGVLSNAALANRVNPFDSASYSPVLEAYPAPSSLPFRPIPVRGVEPGDRGVVGAGIPSDAGSNDDTGARGLFVPSPTLRQQMATGDLENPPFNFDQVQRAFNRGASQEQTKELKEAYLDLETLDSRLWLRIGKQQIVWGKTELFRTTDQFNPQDLALASLPSLEESRIALWALRGVWSFYEVGPLEDVRLEVAMNYDEFQSSDLGACGEPYTVDLVCAASFGTLAHAWTGVGVAGVRWPDNPWESLKGWEVGARLEFRWDRFSFAFMDFWGYNDLPFPTRLTTYERNVDPMTGRPRVFGARGPCTEQDPLTTTNAAPPPGSTIPPVQFDCLRPGPTDRIETPGGGGRVTRPVNTELAGLFHNALDEHHANQTIFAFICSTTVGFLDLDLSACGLNVFGSQAPAGPIQVAAAIGALVAGDPTFNNVLTVPVDVDGDGELDPAFLPFPLPLVELDRGPRDNLSYGCVDINVAAAGSSTQGVPCGGATDIVTGEVPGRIGRGLLAQALSPEQEALLGCGPFWGTHCDSSGLDLLNTDASALLQSFAGYEGTINAVPAPGTEYRTDTGFQPGTEPWVVSGIGGAPSNVCTTGDIGGVEGNLGMLPGCRYTRFAGGAANPLYDPLVDGNPVPLGLQKFTAGPFPVELAFPDWKQIFFNQRNAPPGTPGAGQPFTGAPFASEIAGASWNFQMLVIAFSESFQNGLVSVEKFVEDCATNPMPGCPQNLDVLDAQFSFAYTGAGDARYQPFVGIPEFEEVESPIDGTLSLVPTGGMLGQQHCSFIQPQYCDLVQSLYNVAGVRRNDLRAGGNYQFGRRTFQWHSGGDVVLDFEKRNVLGFSMDFAEDFTKTNWGLEFTWIPDQRFANVNELDGLSRADEFNLTISMDRPTFINFLNPNRTFFITTQWFVQYRSGYNQGFTVNGPWNVLGILVVQSGYFQDRLLPSATFVYDVQSNSGAALAQVGYRISEKFSITVGMAAFMGRSQRVDMPVNEIAPAGARLGRNAYSDSVQNLLAVVRDRDEVWLRLRYSF